MGGAGVNDSDVSMLHTTSTGPLHNVQLLHTISCTLHVLLTYVCMHAVGNQCASQSFHNHFTSPAPLNLLNCLFPCDLDSERPEGGAVSQPQFPY